MILTMSIFFLHFLRVFQNPHFKSKKKPDYPHSGYPMPLTEKQFVPAQVQPHIQRKPVLIHK